MCIWRPPPILIIHLKRFQFTPRGFIKLQSNVEYPIKDFDLSDYMGREKPRIRSADLRYWELLGGKRSEKEEEEKKENQVELKWREFEAESTKSVGSGVWC